MKIVLEWVVNHIILLIIHIILKIDAQELKKVPQKGPILVVANHVNFLDAPVLYTILYPRPVSGIAKKEAWDNVLHGFLFRLWDIIPIERGTADFGAFKLAKSVLNDGTILAFAPEGTRSETGQLQRAKPGVAMLVSQCLDVPILPIAYYGHETLNQNLKRFKRTPMNISVGQPFLVNLEGRQKNRETMQMVTDAIMAEIAKLMPDKYQGVYAEIGISDRGLIEYLEMSDGKIKLSGQHIPQAVG